MDLAAFFAAMQKQYGNSIQINVTPGVNIIKPPPVVAPPVNTKTNPLIYAGSACDELRNAIWSAGVNGHAQLKADLQAQLPGVVDTYADSYDWYTSTTSGATEAAYYGKPVATGRGDWQHTLELAGQWLTKLSSISGLPAAISAQALAQRDTLLGIRASALASGLA